MEMTEAVIFFAVVSILACTIVAAIYGILRNAPSPKRPGQSYRRHRPWNFK